MATSGDGFVVVGSDDGKLRLYSEKTLTQVIPCACLCWLGQQNGICSDMHAECDAAARLPQWSLLTC